MVEVITAVYEKGTLRPLEPLSLREHQRVRIQVITEDASEGEGERARARCLLVSAGLIEPKPSGPIPPDPLSPEERQALADRLGSAQGKTASEMVIEDRGEW